MKYLFFINLLALYFFLNGCTSSKHLRNHNKNKVYVYSSAVETRNDLFDFNSMFIYYKKDTFLWANHGFLEGGSINVSGNNQEDTKIIFELPFTFSRRKKTVFLQFKGNNKSYEKKQFSLIKNDTTIGLNISILCKGKLATTGKIVYTGRDTIFTYGFGKLKCRIFEEFYDQGGSSLVPSIKKTVYYEKHSFIPVKIISTLYPSKNYLLKEKMSEIFELNFVLDDRNIQPFMDNIYYIKNCSSW
jgi:hypothetical protein